ncbi:hypothetical protein ABR39_16385 [Enterobacter genomosp. O]|nr:hypothetical protein ABR39_16385 [Enterobacter genomosp. O]
MTRSGYISDSQDKTAGRRGFGCGQQRQKKILQTEDLRGNTKGLSVLLKKVVIAVLSTCSESLWDEGILVPSKLRIKFIKDI